jgi:dCMP deaminase
MDKQKDKDYFYLRLARLSASRSKDPSTQTGAVIVSGNEEFLGYNGFPKGTDDSPEIYENRELKLSKVIHCEMNAAIKAGNKAEGGTLYTWPFMSCDRCAAHMVQYGITRAVAPKLPQHLEERWKGSIALSRQYFKEAGIELVEYDIDITDPYWTQ